MNNNKVISLAIVFIFLISNTFIAFFMTQSSINSEKKLNKALSEAAKLNENVTIKNVNFDLSIKANYVDDKYIVHDKLMDEDKNYIRVNLTVTNNAEEAEEAMLLLGFILLDNDNNEITICDPIPSFADDPIPKYVAPHSSETFSVYFDTESKDWKTMLIRGEIDGGSESDYYINLKN